MAFRRPLPKHKAQGQVGGLNAAKLDEQVIFDSAQQLMLFRGMVAQGPWKEQFHIAGILRGGGRGLMHTITCASKIRPPGSA